MSKPLKRTLPSEADNRVLTLRDRLILPFVARAGPVSSAQVQRYVGFPSKDVCARRLRALRDHRLCTVHAPFGPSGPNLYMITKRGLDEIRRHTEFDEALVGRSSARLSGNLEHHLLVVDTYVNLVAATTRSQELALLDVQLDDEMRAAVAGRRTVLLPDLAAALEGAGGRRAIWVECDRGTVNPNTVAGKARELARRKARGEALLGCANWCVLMLVPHQRRLERLADRLLDENLPTAFWFFGVSAELDDRHVLTDRWQTALPVGADAAELANVNPFAGILGVTTGRHLERPQRVDAQAPGTPAPGAAPPAPAGPDKPPVPGRSR